MSRRLFRDRLARLEQSAGNALEVIRLGRLAARRGMAFDVVHHERNYRLRHYGETEPQRPVLLLVPPLMLTAEIYDVAPELSALAALVGSGIDAWVVDFGAPEREEGGMDRTLDDHVRAVADAVGRVREATGRDVHLGGYSQGGMFAYQAAAYRASEGIASVITFGSPVDIHKNLPNVSNDVAARVIGAARAVIDPALRHMEGLPGFFSSTGFKLLSLRREVGQLVEFLSLLHDRQALEKRENRRRFLAGEGFVAWPGPALRKFFDEFVVHNRLVSGGFVIDGKTVSLADIACPVLCFVGSRDEFARPASVRAIRAAAPRAEVSEVTLSAGHFGLVVGSTANRTTWPRVAEWMRWLEGRGTRPLELAARGPAPAGTDEDEEENLAIEESLDIELFYDALAGTVSSAWDAVGHAIVDVGDAFDGLRYQLPRLLHLRRLEARSEVSFARALADQARAIPDRTFFLFGGRAFTYRDADARVDAVVRGLIARGVTRGAKVGVVMQGRPSLLTVVTALNRIGAVAVLVSPKLEVDALRRALHEQPLAFVACDPESASSARSAFDGEVFSLGGAEQDTHLHEGVFDLETIDPNAVELPPWYSPNPGVASDLAMIFVTVGASGDVRAAAVTNHRWALSAYGAAAACTLTERDTVYCCLPMHHPTGLLVSVGGALVGGARVALATRFDRTVFWDEVRSFGATVVFYAGEMCRLLLEGRRLPIEQRSSLRLFAGSGLSADAWRELVERTNAGVLEFYGSTEATLVLANASGDKFGALGRALPGSSEALVVGYDVERRQILRRATGLAVVAGHDETGLLVSRLDSRGHVPTSASARILRDVLVRGDAWLATGDLVRRDAEGDVWLVERIADIVDTAQGPVFPRAVEEALLAISGVSLAAAYGAPGEDGVDVLRAAVVERAGETLDAALVNRVLPRASVPWPERIRVVREIPLNDGLRPLRDWLRMDDDGASVRTFHLDSESGRYRVEA